MKKQLRALTHRFKPLKEVVSQVCVADRLFVDRSPGHRPTTCIFADHPYIGCGVLLTTHPLHDAAAFLHPVAQMINAPDMFLGDASTYLRDVYDHLNMALEELDESAELCRSLVP